MSWSKSRTGSTSWAFPGSTGSNSLSVLCDLRMLRVVVRMSGTEIGFDQAAPGEQGHVQRVASPIVLRAP
eukprot:1345281-Rhodomonas_salina.5